MTDAAFIEHLRHQVVQRYGVRRERIVVVFAPYRVCPLGAHIDHQLGRVTAMALDCGIWLAFAPTDGREVRLQSLSFPGEVRVAFEQVPARREGDWGNYARGAILALQQRYTLHKGLVGLTAGRVAEGGLSSSAAVGIAYLLALQHVNQLSVSPEENIGFVQQIENQYLGLQIGILDQSAILLSRPQCLTVIDCASVRHEWIPQAAALPAYRILIAFSGIRKSLSGTDYNLRVSECAQAASILLGAVGRSNQRCVLGHVSGEEYERFRGRLSGGPARRAAHFFAEMQRVRQGEEAWRRGDLREFGRLITQSGESSITNYECGSPPLVDLFHALVEAPGVYGARFSGAGFRGCCLALVAAEMAKETAAFIRDAYTEKHPVYADHAWTLLCQSGDGARLLC